MVRGQQQSPMVTGRRDQRIRSACLDFTVLAPDLRFLTNTVSWTQALFTSLLLLFPLSIFSQQTCRRTGHCVSDVRESVDYEGIERVRFASDSPAILVFSLSQAHTLPRGSEDQRLTQGRQRQGQSRDRSMQAGWKQGREGER